jgi:hypothetical protein
MQIQLIPNVSKILKLDELQVKQLGTVLHEEQEYLQD